MIAFPNAKINLRLNVTGKRPDAYHNIESVFYPIPFTDALEILPATTFAFTPYGIDIGAEQEHNLVVKAYRMMQARYRLPGVEIALLKNIPAGTGLGGGSADAAFCISLLNKLFDLDLSTEKQKELALEIGSDCPFFIDNQPAYVTGRGEEMLRVPLDLRGWHISLVLPGIHISTAEAYKNITPGKSAEPVSEIIQHPISAWRNVLKNDFEVYAFRQFPVLAEIKNSLYRLGAVYASMSGSGSAIYAFSKKQLSLNDFAEFKTWQGIL